MIQPPYPGETLKEDYLVPLNMSVNALAKALGIGAARLNEIVRGKRRARITAQASGHLRGSTGYRSRASWCALNREWQARCA